MYTHLTNEMAVRAIPSGLTEDPRCSSRWSSITEHIREPAVEFFGTMVLVIFGCGGNCQVSLSSNTSVAANPKGEFLSLNLGWAVGIFMGILVSGGVSGSHVNPGVTLALASFRNFPWRKVPYYILAQTLGALCGSGIIYTNYYHATNAYEGGQFLASAMLIISILATTDKRNGPIPVWFPPATLFIAVLGIGLALSMETGAAISLARDLGPRILTAMVGYGKDGS
ncbi:aquaporin-like protein [Pisolithus marmoratus]|nr:aquaporin-like protein [Pisolithus marmoratus]